MRPLLLVFAMLWLEALLAAPETILLADFNDKPLNQPLGTGGAAAGEPTFISPALGAIVRAAPGGGRLLELTKAASPSTPSIRFQFLDNQEVSSGQLRVTVPLQLGIDEFANFGLLLREADGAAQSFLNLNLFSLNRRVQIARPGLPVLGFNNVLELPGRNELSILYDLDELQFSVCLNDQLLVSELSANLETERGIGTLIFTLSDSVADSLVGIHSVEVQRDPVLERVFADRFESGLARCPF